MKEYFFWMDSKFVIHVPQPAQRILAEAYVKKIEGEIIYYSAEELISVPEQLGLREKITRSSNINGFIFFTLKQFSYGGKLDYDLILKMLKMPYELHFVREQYALYDLADFENKFTRLHFYDYSSRLDFVARVEEREMAHQGQSL